MPPVKHRKVVMLGYPSVGKSSLALQFIKGDFPTDYEPTIENTWSKTFVLGTDEFELDVVDTAGQDEYSLLPQSFIFGIHGYIVVYSVACSRSFQIATGLHRVLVDRRGKCLMPIVLVGNKNDLPSQCREVKQEEGKKLADSWGAAFMEVSAKDPEKSKQIFTKIIEEIDRVERSFSEEKKCSFM
ncbi:PREDICTED: GTPase RhebL1 [Nanorana parkeri]|uniref:GTPase RhebL1 n=1 Tax=Nanorana parkeri TaxID=125878 RepID=UPI00085430C6|nr:PREDICTED: GTPase RhebL1 [Nanorana parkeri]